MVSTPISKVPASLAAETRVSTRVRNSSKMAFCTAIFIARMRLSQRWIGGRSSRITPSWSVSSSPLMVWNWPSVVLLSLPVASSPIPVVQRMLGVGAFEIVRSIEHPLPPVCR
jgi:hypothetical protein